MSTCICNLGIDADSLQFVSLLCSFIYKHISEEINHCKLFTPLLVQPVTCIHNCHSKNS